MTLRLPCGISSRACRLEETPPWDLRGGASAAHGARDAAMVGEDCLRAPRCRHRGYYVSAWRHWGAATSWGPNIDIAEPFHVVEVLAILKTLCPQFHGDHGCVTRHHNRALGIFLVHVVRPAVRRALEQVCL